jgi:hypothetical protein
MIFLEYVDALKALKDGEAFRFACVTARAQNDTVADVRDALGVGDAEVRAFHETFAKECMTYAADRDDLVADVAYVIKGAGKELLDYMAKPADVGNSTINGLATPDKRVDGQNR